MSVSSRNQLTNVGEQGHRPMAPRCDRRTLLGVTGSAKPTRKRPDAGSKGGAVHGETRPTSARAWPPSRACARGGASLRHCVSMATGRGRMPRSGRFGPQALRGSLHGDGSARDSAGAAAGRSAYRKGFGVKFARGSPVVRQCTRHGQHNEKSSSISFVSLDSLIWRRIYSAAFASKRSHWKVHSVEETATSVSLLSVEDKEGGYWKKEYITKQISSVKEALTQIAKPVNSYTGLPTKFKEVLRVFGLRFVIILREKSGKEHIMQHVDVSFNDTSVTVVWYGKNWPKLAMLSTLDLCGMTPVFADRHKTFDPYGPRWLSLIAKYDLDHLREPTIFGCDRLVRIFCLNPGLLVGLWQKDAELAFVMANLHFHHLVERSTLGSATLPYVSPQHHGPLLDDSPEYGLQGYQLHIDMHGGGTFFLCSTLYALFSSKECIENGYAKFMVINLNNNRQHLPLIGKVGLAWRTTIFNGFIENCSFMDLTVLEEYRKPFWCVTSPVHLRSVPHPSDGPHFQGHTYYVDYMDPEGGVHAELLWIEETEEYFLVSLVLYLSVAKINHWFGTAY
ncbi:F-box only protein 15 isoform X2 [Microtus pennsylvanicus]|uniref:F-box only protein 15 isoform X2 n=1 Tax=Microtus pennsylvanicus TaxID=10058 RepID=UPI003F6CFFF8